MTRGQVEHVHACSHLQSKMIRLFFQIKLQRVALCSLSSSSHTARPILPRPGMNCISDLCCSVYTNTQVGPQEYHTPVLGPQFHKAFRFSRRACGGSAGRAGGCAALRGGPGRGAAATSASALFTDAAIAGAGASTSPVGTSGASSPAGAGAGASSCHAGLGLGNL